MPTTFTLHRIDENGTFTPTDFSPMDIVAMKDMGDCTRLRLENGRAVYVAETAALVQRLYQEAVL